MLRTHYVFRIRHVLLATDRRTYVHVRTRLDRLTYGYLLVLLICQLLARFLPRSLDRSPVCAAAAMQLRAGSHQFPIAS